uniref:Ribonuclease S-F11 n=2 Tax=Nicotiana alata TaxID=4087 RepID=RNS11_NICAL|nr:RecName: Full=Ribonuclease S-F11; AltName: Full=SF11-RNase; AltName: Full=Stylar glycoprotein F11; Flags: Precursor [Nicotiana alata]1IOO_A Chain A, SF11-RNASE [Nicotiana alata]1IOO_B Chain B, SF11-RNASE [Nicotiana alata]
DFEYLQLVLTWPASFCYANHCERIAPNNFTIHGLWPDNVKTRLHNCKPKPTYSYFTGKMLNDLDKHWMQLKFEQDYGRTEQPSWKYQYIKHGSCCQKRYNQNTYFGLALRLKDKFDLLRTLQTHRIIPGSSYTFQDIFDAIKTVSQENPDIKCAEVTKGTPELYEIGICFTPNADSMFRCPQSDTCDKTAKVLFRR